MQSPSEPLGRPDFGELVQVVKEAVAAAIAEAARPVPQLLDQPAAIKYVGLSRSGWFLAKSSGRLPQPVRIDGSREFWRKQDLDRWLAELKPARRRREKND